jgi:hypothetical protein
MDATNQGKRADQCANPGYHSRRRAGQQTWYEAGWQCFRGMTMRSRTCVAMMTLALGLAATRPADSQVMLQQMSTPTVTAETASWYLDGLPIVYGGNLYYPAGAQVFFNASEMVRSGFYAGIPLYTRTTIEPYSIVYVPLAGGRMQPYERPRTGELTGTAGSAPTLLPTPAATVPPAGLAPQAPVAASGTTTSIDMQWPRPMVAEPVPPARRPAEEPGVVGTTGVAAAPWRPSHVSIGGKPSGVNAMFIEFEGRQWYPAGAPRPFDAARMTRVGDFHGFTVFAAGTGVKDEIYIPSTRGGATVVRYTPNRPASK